MRFDLTPPPAPTWDSHLSDDVRAEVATTLDNVTRIDPRYDSLGVGVRNGEWQDVTPIFQRDPGDEQP